MLLLQHHQPKTSHTKQTNDCFVDMASLLDGIVQHSCRTWSNTVAAGHYTHHEASRNLELIPESKGTKQLGLYLMGHQESMGVWDQTAQEFELKSTLILIYLDLENKGQCLTQWNPTLQSPH